MKTLTAVTLFLGMAAFAGTAQAQTAGTLFWVDAVGEVVGPSDYLYLDDGGFGWHLDPENGLLDSGFRSQYFQTPDCTGPGYVSIYGEPIRVVFRVGGLPGRWVRSDTEQGQKVFPASAVVAEQTQ